MSFLHTSHLGHHIVTGVTASSTVEGGGETDTMSDVLKDDDSSEDDQNHCKFRIIGSPEMTSSSMALLHVTSQSPRGLLLSITVKHIL